MKARVHTSRPPLTLGKRNAIEEIGLDEEKTQGGGSTFDRPGRELHSQKQVNLVLADMLPAEAQPETASSKRKLGNIVAAMATQNALVKVELRGFPSTAVVTTNTVQLTIDLAVLVRGQGDPEDLARARRRAKLTFPSLAGFVGGSAAGGFLETHFGLWGLVLPVALAATGVLLGELSLARPEDVR
jgi:uncharacterized membrane protein YoaK (UPF0700 family)